MEKVSSEWIKEYACKILDPDGWDRKNFDYSFNKEKITRREFERRLIGSTIQGTPCPRVLLRGGIKEEKLNWHKLPKERKILGELDGFCKGAIENLNNLREELKTIEDAVDILNPSGQFMLNLNGTELWVRKLQTNYNGILGSLRKLLK